MLRTRRAPGPVLGLLLGLILFLACAAAGAGAAAAPVVVTSIKPVHALAAAVMQGAGTPHLIVRGGASPHSHGLRPSDAAALEEAEVVIWVGAGLETFLAASLESLAGRARVIELSKLPGLTRLAYREGGAWDDHSADGHESEEHAKANGHGDGHDAIDLHLWLDPDNAKVMMTAIAAALIETDPDNAGTYYANSKIMAYRLDLLGQEIADALAPVKDVPFVVFHDAFQYFDAYFGLANVGSVTVDPERQPGAARLKEIRRKIADLNARCVFAEPQFEPRLIEVVIEGSDARRGTLDPIGADLEDGPELYFELMWANARALQDCLGGPG